MDENKIIEIPNEILLPLAPEKGHANRIYLGALIGVLFGAPLALRIIDVFFPRIANSSLALLSLATLITAFLLMAPGMIWSGHFPNVRSAIGFHRLPRFTHYVAITLLSVCAVLLADAVTWAWSGFLSYFGYVFPADEMSGLGRYAPVTLLIVIAVVPAISEEYLFRGVLLSSYRNLGEGGSIFLTALLFAAMHGTLAALPAHMLMGLLLGYCVVKTGSLHAGIYLHFLYNGIIVLSDYFTRVNFLKPILSLQAEGSWYATWPLLIGAALAAIACLQALRASATPAPKMRAQVESGTVWLPVIFGLLVCSFIYVGSALAGFLPQINQMEIWR